MGLLNPSLARALFGVYILQFLAGTASALRLSGCSTRAAVGCGPTPPPHGFACLAEANDPGKTANPLHPATNAIVNIS